MDFQALKAGLPASWLPWVLALLLLMLLLATLEGVVMTLLRRPYDWGAYGVSLADAFARRGVEVLGLSLASPALAWVWEHRFATIPLDGVTQWLLLFVGLEFMYYWYHRALHRIRWFWATHAVHHSPNELTLMSSVRLGWMSKLVGNPVFFAPLLAIGFSPAAVFGAFALNLLYQFWLHTTWIPKLGPLEWVLNTPSHHRVHHGSNPEYLDCNYGGVLIVFDRLFGTFVAERDDLPPRYGLTDPITSRNPVVVTLREWWRLGRDALRAGSPWRALKVVLGPPSPARPG